jgi:hypothetical protein
MSYEFEEMLLIGEEKSRLSDLEGVPLVLPHTVTGTKDSPNGCH